MSRKEMLEEGTIRALEEKYELLKSKAKSLFTEKKAQDNVSLLKPSFRINLALMASKLIQYLSHFIKEILSLKQVIKERTKSHESIIMQVKKAKEFCRAMKVCATRTV